MNLWIATPKHCNSKLIKLMSLLMLCIASFGLMAQTGTQATLQGKVTNEKGRPLELVNVSIFGLPGGTATDQRGDYTLRVPANEELRIIFSFVGFESSEKKARLSPGESLTINITLVPSAEMLPDITIQDERIRNTNLQRIDPKGVTVIPSVTGSVESLIKTLPGVASNNELSSQYSVRGGNFDENLVYVNGIEIYRPFLIRSGQQEGMSFLNSDLTASILFSAGGFDARYGDKMSSALDIKYKRPQEFGGSVTASLLGATAHLEGVDKSNRFSYLAGVRYKSNQYVLKGLETKGDYQPVFFDVQTLLRYQLSEKLELSFLGNYADNKFELVPTTRETNFGTISEAKRLTVYFDGRETDQYKTYMGALKLIYNPTKQTQLNFITSAFNSDESETFDIQGQYWIGRVQSGLGQSDFGDVVSTDGVGTFLNHARNYLNATVMTAEHRGSWESASNYLTWGVKYQHEIIDDALHEWELIDSAGFTLPHPPNDIGAPFQPLTPLTMNFFASSDVKLSSNRYSGFIQNTWNLGNNRRDFAVTAGVRSQYWDYSEEFLVSPRASLSYHPKWTHDILFRLAAGYYYQPAFYRELRNFDGQIVEGQKAQKSIHLVGGADWNLTIWGRPFKFVTEVYYKFLDDLIPYEVDNVRIRYYANERARGYATGIDVKINGEFVPGIESWASLSVMKTQEDIYGDFYYQYFNAEGEESGTGSIPNPEAYVNEKVEPGYIPRPTDQRVRFSMFFQDYLPMNPTYKMHLALYFGTSLPFGPPKSQRYQQVFRMPSYRRVDIGFSKQLIGSHTSFKEGNPLGHLKSMWLSLEIFNLLQVNNTISYLWITDVSGRKYAVPNFLTPRQINLKLVVQF
ncbi:MAG TPA: TonB-dependent receptor [Bacteroidales bacterium]|nr:TonB-dependent receptor [Bacteroidales bacterium]